MGSNWLDYRAEGLLVGNARLLRKAMENPPLYSTQNCHQTYACAKRSTSHVGTGRTRDEIPSPVGVENKNFVKHSGMPIRVLEHTTISFWNGRERRVMKVLALKRLTKPTFPTRDLGVVVGDGWSGYARRTRWG